MSNGLAVLRRKRSKAGKQLIFSSVPLVAIDGIDPAVASVIGAYLDTGAPQHVFTTLDSPAGVVKITTTVLTRTALTWLQYLSPIIVIQCRGGYRCVAGILTLQSARLLDPDRQSQVMVVVLPRRFPEQDRLALAYASALVQPFLTAHVWVDPPALGYLWTRLFTLSSDLLKEMLPEATSKRGIVRLRGVSYNTMFPGKKRNEEKGGGL